MAKATTTKRKPSEVAKQKAEEQARVDALTNRPVKYPNVFMTIHCKDWEKLNKESGSKLYAPPITAEDAKKTLGWESEDDYLLQCKRDNPSLTDEELDKLKWGSKDFFLTDKDGKKVRLHNNIANRPWTESVSIKYMQDVLRKHWMFNGENMIIGKTGMVLSAQHRLIGLVFAEQLRKGKEKDHWIENWSEPCYMETCVVYGIDESPQVRRTIDNVKTRSLSDVLFADTSLLARYKMSERKELARMVDFAIRSLWKRLAIGDDTFAQKRTHSESLEFVDRHSTLLECIAHIHEENKDNRISKQYLYSGTAAALMYLMATGDTKDNCEDYHAIKPKNESRLNMKLLKKAKRFWTDLARGDASFKNLRLCRRPLVGDNLEDGFTGFVFTEPNSEGKVTIEGGSVYERMAAIVHAWNAYKSLPEEEFETQEFELQYKFDLSDDEPKRITGIQLNDYPLIVGADLGDKPKALEPKPEGVKGKKGRRKKGEEGEPGGDEFAQKDELASSDDANMLERWKGDKDEETGYLFYETKSGNYLTVHTDAKECAKLLNMETSTHPSFGYEQLVISPEEFENAGDKLVNDEGKDVTVCHEVDGDLRFTQFEDFMSGETDDVDESDDDDENHLLEGNETDEEDDEDEGLIEDDEPAPEPEPEKPRKVVRKG